MTRAHKNCRVKLLRVLAAIVMGFFGQPSGLQEGHATTPPSSKLPKEKTAYMAGGCFWCLEHDMARLPGVLRVQCGYMGGAKETATYQKVSSGRTRHREAIKIVYNPAKISFESLIKSFMVNHDPFDQEGSFCDRGKQYTAALFVANETERDTALTVFRQAEQKLKRKIKTPILPVAPFYPAEAEHQDYATRNPIRYKFYRSSCGRDKRLREIWRR